MASEDQEILAKISQLAGEFATTSLFLSLVITNLAASLCRSDQSAQEWSAPGSTNTAYANTERQHAWRYGGVCKIQQTPR
jgi:hypothetical protein